MHRFLLAGLLFGSVACASSPHPWSRRTLCEMGLERSAPAVADEAWLELLVRGYDPQTREATSPAVDCTGMQVRWDAPAAACFDGALAKTLLPGRPLERRDLVVTPLTEDVQLVWVMTGHYASGDAMGPVAVVERKRGYLLVRAAGVLRSYPERVKLRLEKLGGTEILVAEGERCASSDPGSCQRAARLLPLRGDRFEGEPLVSEAGACVSPAWVDLAREESERLDSGFQRRYQLAASLSFEPALLHIDEQLLVHEVDPQKPKSPARLSRRAHADRTVTLMDGKLVATEQSLWAKMLNGRE